MIDNNEYKCCECSNTFMCSECEKTYCINCIHQSKCINMKVCVSIFVLDCKIDKCSCGKIGRASDILPCEKCSKNICFRCSADTFCNYCLESCEECGGTPKFGDHCCIKCRRILCQKEMIESVCFDCS